MNFSKYQEYYELLGISPGDSWSRIRNAHKTLMKHWHPDRYSHDAEGRIRAEEMTKNHYLSLLVMNKLRRTPSHRQTLKLDKTIQTHSLLISLMK
jgi:preprotein translocase subunit Sec63